MYCNSAVFAVFVAFAAVVDATIPERTYLPPAVSRPHNVYLPPVTVQRPVVTSYHSVPEVTVHRSVVQHHQEVRPQNVYLPPSVSVQRPVVTSYHSAPQVTVHRTVVQHQHVARPQAIYHAPVVTVHRPVVQHQQQVVRPLNVYLPPAPVVQHTVSHAPSRTYLPPQGSVSSQDEHNAETFGIDLRGGF